MPSRLAVLRCRLTAEHIRDGIPGNIRWCPIALAVRDAHPDIINAWVERWTIRWTDRTTWIRYESPMPPRLQRWHEQFDQHGPQAVSPTRFRLSAARESPYRRRQAAPPLPRLRTGIPAYSTSYRASLSELAAIAREQVS